MFNFKHYPYNLLEREMDRMCLWVGQAVVFGVGPAAALLLLHWMFQ